MAPTGTAARNGDRLHWFHLPVQKAASKRFRQNIAVIVDGLGTRNCTVLIALLENALAKQWLAEHLTSRLPRHGPAPFLSPSDVQFLGCLILIHESSTRRSFPTANAKVSTLAQKRVGAIVNVMFAKNEENGAPRVTTAELEVAPTSPQKLGTSNVMKALVYRGPGKKTWQPVPRPTIQDPSDAVVRITSSTICGTDLHILKGDLPSVTDGRILGHEGIGIIEQVGTAVSEFHIGDKVIISCITACLKCDLCRRGMYSHCRHGGWILGNTIDGTQAEYVRIPHADGSLHFFPSGGDEESLVMLSDILPTGFECGVLSGQMKPGDTVAIVGAGPIGLAVLLTAQFYSPASIFMIDLDDKRLAVAKQFGATTLINSSDGHATRRIMELTRGTGVDVAVEAVGLPPTFDICQAIVAVGGRIANVGVHGKAVELHMEKLWDRNISLTTRLVDTSTTPMLLKIVSSGKLQPGKLVTHRFAMNDIMKAYDTFENAAKEGALKVVLTRANHVERA
jgi:alcohol dehydrogenase